MSGKVDDIFGLTLRLILVGWPRVALCVATLATLGFLVDSGLITDVSWNLLISAFMLALQYWLTRTLLADLGYGLSERPRGFAFVGLSMVTGLGIVLGFVLLIAPGLILLARWSVSLPWLLSGDEGVFESMRRSWDQTADHVLPVVAVFLIIYLPGLAVYGGGGWVLEASGSPFLVAAAMNWALSLSQVVAWVVSVAIFALLNESLTLSEVFE